MSVMHTIIAASRQYSRTVPTWSARLPRDTTFATRDVRVGDRSLRQISEERRTPCVLITPAAGSMRDRFVSAVVTTVTGREVRGLMRRSVHLRLDCNLDSIADRVTFGVLLDGATDRRLVSRVLVGAGPAHVRVTSLLPASASAGDKIVLFCDGTVARSELAAVALSVTPCPKDEASETGMGRCGR
jgi:hypothetical protein